MLLSRRDTIKLLGACVATGSLDIHALAQAKAAAPRVPLEDFVKDDKLVKDLRKGVAAMKKRKPSDPLSWFFQAAIHAVTGAAVDDQIGQDSVIRRSCWTRYWNQCPHFGENSANFLPWHRGYTYHFEKILRLHTENDQFSIPYWNYTDPQKPQNRYFPKEFGIQHLDGNLQNNADENINPLYHPDRDFYFCGYEHPFATGLPLLALTESAVDITLPMSAAVFFGETEREGLAGGIADEDPSTRGLLESYPHDQIHRAVGGIIGDKVGAMATPPTAAFDPIFPAHHSNIDRLWAVWSCLPDRRWGKLPPKSWFDEKPWIFFDTDGKEVNQPRKAYFDYRALGIRFKDEDEKCKPLSLPDLDKVAVEATAARVRRLEMLAQHKEALAAVPLPNAVLPIPAKTLEKIQAHAGAVRAAMAKKNTEQRMIVRLTDVDLGLVRATGFDVHLTDDPKAELTRKKASFVGSISMFRHEVRGGHGGHGGGHGKHESFDVTRAVAELKGEKLAGLSLVLVPYSLLGAPKKDAAILNDREMLKASGIEFLKMELK